MERISLPTRTVTTQYVVVVVLFCVVSVFMLAWVADLLAIQVAKTKDFADFRTVVLTRTPIRSFRNGEIQSELTLFQRGGKTQALADKADDAMRLDPWSGSMRYFFGQALWREYQGPVSPEGKTLSGKTRTDIPSAVETALQGAIRNNPANRFYRATYVEVLLARKDPARDAEIGRLLAFYPPQNAYAELKEADILASRGVETSDKKVEVLKHYVRALELVSADISSGLVDTRVDSLPSLGPILATQIVDGLIRNVGDYNVWGRQLPSDESPEVHWLVAENLKARGLMADADKEYQAVVSSVNVRLNAEKGASPLVSLFQIICPLSKPDFSKRYLMNREIGLASGVLKDAKRLDEAIVLARVQVSRMPGNVKARLDLGNMLLDRARELAGKYREYRDAHDDTRAAEMKKKVDDLYDEADQQASAILKQEPRSDDALKLRAQMPGGGGEAATP